MQTLCHNWLVTVGSALTGLCACLAAAAELSRVPKPADRAAWDQYIREGWDSPFGLDYVFVLGGEFRKPDLARQLGGFVGVRWVNFARVNWGEIEPKAPVAGKHTYRWAPLDEAVRQWQEQGVHIMMSLRFVCRWANATPSLKPLYLDGLLSWIPKTAADYRPKPEHQQALRDFITALVERYDGDGIGDPDHRPPGGRGVGTRHHLPFAHRCRRLFLRHRPEERHDDGDPAYPEAPYVVVSVMAGTVTETAAYAWDPQRRDFVSVPLRGV